MAWILIDKGMAGYISSIVWDSGWLMLIVAGGIPMALIYFWRLVRVLGESGKTEGNLGELRNMRRLICFGASDSYISDVLIGTVFKSPQVHYKIKIVGCVDTARPKRGYKTAIKKILYKLKLNIAGDPQTRCLSRIPSFLKVASSESVPVIKAQKGQGINSPWVLNWLKEKKPDYILVMGCPQILNRSVLEIPHIASVNYHYSALPKFAGCNAPFWPLLYGEKETANTFHIIEETTDTGPIVIQEPVPIYEDDTDRELRYRLVMSAKDLIIPLLNQMVSGELQKIPQDNKYRSYRSAKEYDLIGQICWELPSKAIERICRIYGRLSAFLPNGQTLIAYKISLEPDWCELRSKPPGTVLRVEKGEILCVCGDGLIWFWKKKILGLLHDPFESKIKPGDRLTGRSYSEKLDGPLLKFVAKS